MPTSGPLQAGSPIPLPFAADRVTAAESPDGAVFAAPQDPTSPAPAVAWVVDGSGPAAIAEHVATGIAALAADSANFYVATYSDVFAYSRASGNQDGQWTMPTVNATNSSDDDLVSMTAAGGAVLVSVTRGNTVSVYRITPTRRPRRICSYRGSAPPSDRTAPSTTSAPTTTSPCCAPAAPPQTGAELNHTPNGLGGGVQYVNDVAGGAVWVSQPAGQGLDAQFTTYDAASLAVLGSYTGTVTSSVVDTAAGPLALEQSGSSPSCPQTTSPVVVRPAHRPARRA